MAYFENMDHTFEAQFSEAVNIGGSGTGADGASAYEIAVKNGFEGTEKEWLASLEGEPGKDGVDGKDGKDVELDTTLTQSGKAADAKSVGDELAKKMNAGEGINPNWENWNDVRYYYGFNKNLQPVFNTVKGVLESDTMISVRGGKGRWNKTNNPSSGFVSGGHVFEGWSGQELSRLTMLMGKFHETFACIQTYSPAGLYEAARRFGWVKLGADEMREGFDFSRNWSTCYTPLTLIPRSKPTSVADYDLNPQFASSAVPVGTMYYDQTENRIKLYTSSGWKTVAFVGDVTDSGGSDSGGNTPDTPDTPDTPVTPDTGGDDDSPFTGEVGYLTYMVRVEDGVVSNVTQKEEPMPEGRIAYFNIDDGDTYTVTRSAMSARFRIYLYNASSIEEAIANKEAGYLVAEDSNHNAISSLTFTNDGGYNLAVVMLANNPDTITQITVTNGDSTNLLDGKTFEAGYIYHADGTFTSSAAFNMACQEYIPVKGGATYRADVTGITNNLGNAPSVGASYYLADKTLYTGDRVKHADHPTPATFTVPSGEGIAYARFFFTVGDGNASHTADWTNAEYSLTKV